MLSECLVIGLTPRLGFQTLRLRETCSLAVRYEPYSKTLVLVPTGANLKLTYGPESTEHAFKDATHFILIVRPLSADKRHSHRPKAPAQERHPLQLLLSEPATPTEHARAHSQLLNKVKVGPLYMITDDNCRFLRR